MEMDIEVLRSHELYEQGVYTGVTSEAHREHGQVARDPSRRHDSKDARELVALSAAGGLETGKLTGHSASWSTCRRLDQRRLRGRGRLGGAARITPKGEGKLGWRVELAARWKALGVTFEPFGKDHTTQRRLDRHRRPHGERGIPLPCSGPLRVRVDRASRAAGDMSSSRGIVLLPKDLLRIMPPGARAAHNPRPRPLPQLRTSTSVSGFPRFMDEYRAETGEPFVPSPIWSPSPRPSAKTRRPPRRCCGGGVRGGGSGHGLAR